MQSHSEFHEHDGVRVESATIVHEGKSFTALGSVVDHARGFVVGYVSGEPGAWRLTTWDGTTIAPLTRVRSWTQWGFGAVRNEIHAWRAVIDGKTYSGRNSGPTMVLRMRTRLPHEPIPADFEVQPLAPGQAVTARATCGQCGLSWDDGASTSRTPTPAGRCPFEYFHKV